MPSPQFMDLSACVWPRNPLTVSVGSGDPTIKAGGQFQHQQGSTVAQATKERPRAWLEQERLYGDLVEAKPFADAFEAWLSLIWSDGCEAALKKYLAA